MSADVEVECPRCGDAFLVTKEVARTGERLAILCGYCTDDAFQRILDALEHPGQHRVASDPEDPWSEMEWR